MLLKTEMDPENRISKIISQECRWSIDHRSSEFCNEESDAVLLLEDGGIFQVHRLILSMCSDKSHDPFHHTITLYSNDRFHSVGSDLRDHEFDTGVHLYEEREHEPGERMCAIGVC
jgi:hypothetical protein